MKQSRELMLVAIKEAETGIRKRHGYPFGAAISFSGKLLCSAHNEVIKRKDPTAHAEILAIRQASKKLKKTDLSECTLFSTGEPCPMCLSAVFWAGIKKVFFGCKVEETEKEGFEDKFFFEQLKKPGKRIMVEKQLMEKECQQIFKEWEKTKKH